MLPLDLTFSGTDSPIILCLGAHSDDIELGAAATIIGLRKRLPHAQITWVVFAASGQREAEARASAEYCCEGFRESDIRILSYSDGYFPSQWSAIKKEFERMKGSCEPDLILTHYGGDAHQDHQLVSQLTWQTYRNHLILEYEIMKYDGDVGRPNVYCALSMHEKNEKIMILERFFESQHSKSWFARDVFDALMRMRGIECNSESGFAEAFYGRKLVLGSPHTTS